MPGAPSSAQPKGRATPEDTEDIKNLVQGIFGGAAAMTGFTGWVFTDAEAEAVALPASRILARHTVVQGYVRDIADPVALIVALGLPTIVRYQLYRMWLFETQRLKTVQPNPATPPPNNGATSTNSVYDKLRNT